MYLIHWYEAMNATTGKGKRFGTGGEFHTRGREMQPRRCALLRGRRVRESIMSDER